MEEWLQVDEKGLQYHIDQYKEPKEYTKHLLDKYLKYFNGLKPASNILDIGCGAGAVTYQFAERFPHLNFIGVDINNDLIAIANRLKRENTSYFTGDLKQLSAYGKEISCITCFQTLSWLPDYSDFVSAIQAIGPDFCILTALFYDGPVDAFIKIRDHSRTMDKIQYKDSFYNIYSISKFNDYLKDHNLCVSEFEPFEIKVDLPRGDKGMATYTIDTAEGKKLQISGPLLMSWYTLGIRKL